jgi:hypothetical protein
MYRFQDNNGDVEVYLEIIDGFEWVCNCGSSELDKSWENAIKISGALNDTLFEKKSGQ